MCFYVCVCMWWRGVGGVWGEGMSCHISYLTQLCSRPCSRDHAVNSAHNSFWSYHRNALWYNPREAQSRWQRCLGLSRDYQTPFPVEINDRHSIDGIFFDLIFIISQISASKESKLLQNVEICQLILWKNFSNHYVKKKIMQILLVVFVFLISFWRTLSCILWMKVAIQHDDEDYYIL